MNDKSSARPWRDSEDEELVVTAVGAGQGDVRAFEELVRRHESRVLTNCRYLTRRPEDAPDLAQEVFVKAFFALPRFEGRAKFGTWLSRIKVNHCLNHLRRRRVDEVDIDDEVVAQSEELSVGAAVEEHLESEDRAVEIRACLDRMPESLRVPLILRDLDELSYEEIATELSIGLSATKMRIKRARERFRAIYEGSKP